MSIKIYEGKRFPKAKLATFIREVRRAQWKIILERARVIAADLKDVSLEGKSWTARVMATCDLFREIAEKSHRQPLLDLECGWKIWVPEHGRFAYTTPWGEHIIRNKLVMPAYVEDYVYWDNTDEPEGMSMREWNRRRKNWECATEPHREQDYVLLVVFEAKGISIADLHVQLDRLGPPSAIDRLAAVGR